MSVNVPPTTSNPLKKVGWVGVRVVGGGVTFLEV